MSRMHGVLSFFFDDIVIRAREGPIIKVGRSRVTLKGACPLVNYFVRLSTRPGGKEKSPANI